MQFDVIIGNPPYQLDDGGFGTSAAPIYHLFVEQAKKLEPRFLSHGYSVPLVRRWQGAWTSSARRCLTIIACARFMTISDASDVFPGVGLKGGVCYFLWDRDNPATAASPPISRMALPSTARARCSKRASMCSSASTKGCRSSRRSLLSRPDKRVAFAPEASVLIELVSSSKPFGLRTFFQGQSEEVADGDVLVYLERRNVGYMRKDRSYDRHTT